MASFLPRRSSSLDLPAPARLILPKPLPGPCPGGSLRLPPACSWLTVPKRWELICAWSWKSHGTWKKPSFLSMSLKRLPAVEMRQPGLTSPSPTNFSNRSRCSRARGTKYSLFALPIISDSSMPPCFARGDLIVLFQWAGWTKMREQLFWNTTCQN